jgi:NADH-quinone oxidoreductase subunit J
MVQNIVFALLAVMTLVPALLVVTVKNIFHAALYLVVSLTGVAGLFAMMGADFLFVSQILVYSGGILILLLFVVLLSGSPKDWATRALNEQWMASALVSAVFIALLAVLLRALPEAVEAGPASPTSNALGVLLLKDMVLPFEAVSFVLLAALAGAVHFSKKDTPHPGLPPQGGKGNVL